MFTKNPFNKKDEVADMIGNILEADYKVKKEELKGNQHKIDMNKNNKIDAHDFKLLRSKGASQKDEEIDPNKVTTDTLKGRTPGKSANPFLSQKAFMDVPDNVKEEAKGVAEGSEQDDHDYDDGEDRLSGRHGLSADPKKMAVYYPNDPERTKIRTQMNVPNLKKAIKSNLGKHKKPNLPEQGVAEGSEQDDDYSNASFEKWKQQKAYEKEYDKKKPAKPIVPDNKDKKRGVAEEVEQIDERELTKGETKEKERIVKGMKKSLSGFKQRYGDRAKSVMYATATKAAKKD